MPTEAVVTVGHGNGQKTDGPTARSPAMALSGQAASTLFQGVRQAEAKPSVCMHGVLTRGKKAQPTTDGSRAKVKGTAAEAGYARHGQAAATLLSTKAVATKEAGASVSLSGLSVQEERGLRQKNREATTG